MDCLFKIRPEDNVATALVDLQEGSDPPHLQGGHEYPLYEEGKGQTGSLIVLRDIPQYKKVALAALEPGAVLIKFGYPIAQICLSVKPGMLLDLSTLSFVATAVGIYDRIPFDILGTAKGKIDPKAAIHVGEIQIKPEMCCYLEPFFDLSNLKTTLGKSTARDPISRGSNLYVGNLIDLEGRGRGERAQQTIAAYYNLIKDNLFLEQLVVKGAPLEQ